MAPYHLGPELYFEYTENCMEEHWWGWATLPKEPLIKSLFLSFERTPEFTRIRNLAAAFARMTT